MDYFVVAVVLLFGYFFKNNFPLLNKKDLVLLDQLFFYHILMSIIFFTYITFQGGDSQGYWNQVKLIPFDKLWGRITGGSSSVTNYVYLLNYFPSNVLNLHFFTGCIIYGVIGYTGIVYLILTLKEIFPLIHYVKNIKFLNISIYPTLLFLPNFHFWSAGVGKDTILFFCACAFFYCIHNLKRRIPLMLIVIILGYFLRPHILLFLLSGAMASFILKSNLYKFQKFIIIIIAFILFIPLLNNVLEFAKIDEASIDSFNEFSETKSSALSRGHTDSAIDIGNLPYPLQVLTFLYRPLFFDSPNMLGLLASVENVIWIVLSIIFFKSKPRRVFKQSHYIILSTFLYWIIGALAFAPILGNLGIIIRERNMFLPGFIIFAVAGLYNSTKFRKFEWNYYKAKDLYYKNLEKEKQKVQIEV